MIWTAKQSKGVCYKSISYSWSLSSLSKYCSCCHQTASRHPGLQVIPFLLTSSHRPWDNMLSTPYLFCFPSDLWLKCNKTHKAAWPNIDQPFSVPPAAVKFKHHLKVSMKCDTFKEVLWKLTGKNDTTRSLFFQRNRLISFVAEEDFKKEDVCLGTDTGRVTHRLCTQTAVMPGVFVKVPCCSLHVVYSPVLIKSEVIEKADGQVAWTQVWVLGTPGSLP